MITSPKEDNQINIGTFFVVSLFPLQTALACILILACGDSLSHIFGIHYGKIKHPFTDKKNLEGMLVGFVAAFAAALIFLPWPQALAGSLAAMLVEGVEIKFGSNFVDDNLIIPIVAGVAMLVMGLII